MKKNWRKSLELKTSSIIRGKKHFIHIKGSILQEDTIININAPNYTTCKYLKKKLTEGRNRQNHNHNHNCSSTHSSGNYRTWQNVNNNTDHLNGSIFCLHFFIFNWHNNCRSNIILKYIRNCMEVEHMLGYQEVSLKNHLLKSYRITSWN